MATRRLLVFALIALCTSFAGCHRLFDSSSQSRSSRMLDEDIALPLGIEVEVRVRSATSLRESAEVVTRVTPATGSGIQVVRSQVSGGDILLTLKGKTKGVFDLTIQYEGARRSQNKQVFVVRVEELARSFVRIECEGEASQSPAQVPTGATIAYRAFGAVAGHDSVSLGTFDPVEDAAGFERPNDDELVRIAPSEPGTYRWKLKGRETAIAEFIVYDPAQIKPKLAIEPRSPGERQRVIVTPWPYLGEPREYCIKPELTELAVEILEGDCRVALGDVELEDGLSVDAADGDREFWLSGQGECSVAATWVDGGRTATTVNIDRTGAAPSSGGTPIPEEPLQVVSVPDVSMSSRELEACREYLLIRDDQSCASGLVLQSDGEPTCVDSAVWYSTYVDAPDDDRTNPLGVGLTTELLVGVDINQFGIPISRLQVSPLQDTLSWRELGCIPGARAFQLSAAVAGDYALTLSADNAPGTYPLLLDVDTIEHSELVAIKPRTPRPQSNPGDPTSAPVTPAPVTTVPATTVPGIPPTLAPSPVMPPGEPCSESETPSTSTLPTIAVGEGVSTRHVFVGGHAVYRLRYWASAEQCLRGVGPVFARVDASEPPGTRVHAASTEGLIDIDFGATTHVVELFSPHAPDVHRVVVEDASGIAQIGGLYAIHLGVGEMHCLLPRPLSASGVLIEGSAPSLPRVKGTRGMFVTADGNTVCFEARSANTTTLDWVWGSASATTELNAY